MKPLPGSFFPEDLHTASIRLFDACEREHITRLATLQGEALQTEAEALAERIFSNSHPIYAMLFDLQALDVVRIIEERDMRPDVRQDLRLDARLAKASAHACAEIEPG